MAIFPQQESFHPPALPDAGASYPDRVLLGVRGYIADRTNETTATSFTSKGQSIQVSFFAAKPPALSYLCVHCPDAVFASDPRVIASQGNLILFMISIRSGEEDSYEEEICSHYFVYRADGTGSSSLDLLPAPGRHIHRANVGLVASGSRGGGYVVAILSSDPNGERYVLRLHHEKTGLWRRKMVSKNILLMESTGVGMEEVDLPVDFTQSVTLQGSNIAWIDIRDAVLLCDVLDDDPVAYCIPLPEPLSDRNKEILESLCDPRFFRDIIGRPNSIKLVEMEYRYDADFAPAGWRAVTYSWTIGSNRWCMDSVVDFEDVLESSGGLLSLLCPDKRKGVESKNVPPLCVPTLCDRDNVLYLMSKPNRREPKGSVVVLDTAKKTLKSVTPMSEVRVTGYALTFVHSTFSKCFNVVADACPKVEDRTSSTSQSVMHDL